MAKLNLDLERLLDSKEAARLLKVNPKTVQLLARSGDIPAVRIGKLWRFHRVHIEKWLRSKLPTG